MYLLITRPCSQKYLLIDGMLTLFHFNVSSSSPHRCYIIRRTFRIYPYTQLILARLYLSILNIGKSFYFSRFYRSKTYQLINDRYLPSSSKRFSYTCKKGDLLVADVRMLHRDSPCSSGGYRVALHCYLGANPNNFPNA